MSRVLIEHLSVRFGTADAAPVIQDLSLVVPEGEFCVLLGPSGCGKSTVLNAVSGLIRPKSASRICVGGTTLFDGQRGVNVSPDKRRLGMVFQSYALWPHMKVRDNIGYPLKRRGIRNEGLRRRVDELLELMRCSDLGDRFPSELSGGQQQRIALARGLAIEPQLLLLDEPLSNLDAELRRDLRAELRLLHRRLGFTALYVTHDHVEALGLGTMVVVMNKGRVEQVGDPQAVFESPASQFSARFFGANMWTVSVRDGVASTPIGDIPVRREVEESVVVAAYPSRVTLAVASQGVLTVEDARFVGSKREFVAIDPSGRRIRVDMPPHGAAPQIGDTVRPEIAEQDIHIYANSYGRDRGAIGPVDGPVQGTSAPDEVA